MTERYESSVRHAQPPISAVFLVVFDQKIGYSIAYQRTIPGLQLEGVVEYKSLPSGLHNVQSDLVYFVHEQNAGVSAFVQGEAGESDRNAHFAAVGVLVPLSYGRLGRSWLHAESLRELALHSVKDLEDTHKLEAYWQKHRIDQGEADGKNAPKESTPERHQGSSHQRKTRALSDAAASGQNTQSLSVDHPALSLTHHLDIFGPSLFVLYRAALARKRILLLTHPPVRSACDLVYNMSILANIPPHCAELLRDPDAMFPLRPLFNVGVHDIGYLSDLANAESGPESYIACSTDEILATKQDLYDILVELPQEATEPGKKHWPKLRNARGDHIRATQRDLRRYRALKKELVKIEHSTSSRYRDEEDGAEDEDTEEEHEAEDYDDTTPLNQKTRGEWGTDEEGMALSGEADLVEPTSWAAVAYTGFLWWASAGEKDSWLEEEASQDGALLSDLPLPSPANHNSSRQVLGDDGGRKGPSARNGKAEAGDAQAVAMDVIAFAHRLTTMTLESMSEMVAAADEENDDNGTNGIIHIESEDLRRMGLDVWSEADGEFARDMFELYFQREAEVRGQGVECCGIKIC